MSRWGRGRGGSVAVPLDSALFRENSNCPSAARSAGTVGKWGITSFTSIRSAPYAFASSVKKPVQDQNSPLTVPAVETEQPPPKPKKFFKSRNAEPYPPTPQIVYAPSTTAAPLSPEHPSNSKESKKTNKRNKNHARDSESPEAVRFEKTKSRKNSVATKAAKKEDVTNEVNKPPNKRYLVRNRNKIINYAEDGSNSPIPEFPPYAAQHSKQPSPKPSPSVSSPAYVKPDVVSPMPKEPSEERKPPPIVLRISKGTSRIVSTDSNEGFTSPSSDRNSSLDMHPEPISDIKASPSGSSICSPRQEGLKITIKCPGLDKKEKKKDKKEHKSHKRHHKTSDDEPLKKSSPVDSETYELYKTLASPVHTNKKEKAKPMIDDIESQLAELDSLEPTSKSPRLRPEPTQPSPEPKPPENTRGRSRRNRPNINYNENDNDYIEALTNRHSSRQPQKALPETKKETRKSKRKNEAAATVTSPLNNGLVPETESQDEGSDLINILAEERPTESEDGTNTHTDQSSQGYPADSNIETESCNREDSPSLDGNDEQLQSSTESNQWSTKVKAHDTEDNMEEEFKQEDAFKAPQEVSCSLEQNEEKQCVKLVITKKKGSIFKSKSLMSDNPSPLPARKRRHLYKHEWNDKGNETPRSEPGQNENPASSHQPAAIPEELTRVTRYHSPDPIVDDPESADAVKPYTSVKCAKEAKEYYTVVRNVKKAHQIQEIGEYQEFNDDVDYLLDALQNTNPISTRCLSAITLATKCTAPAFRMHLRAHGTVQKFFSALHDATNDQSLGLCTATVMFVLSQDRLNMDLDRESLELMLNLLESDVSHKNALEDCGMTSAQLTKTQERVRELCAEIKNQGKAKHLDLDNITVGHLAMETLLSLTSKRAGEWFKEELRALGGIDHILKTIKDCTRRLSPPASMWGPQHHDLLRKADRCMRVLENVTQQNEENQLYLVSDERVDFVPTLASLLWMCIQEARTGKARHLNTALLDAALPAIKVLVNLSHSFGNTASLGANVVGEQVSVMEICLIILNNQENFVPEDRNFEFSVCVLLLLINLVQNNECNTDRLLNVHIRVDNDNNIMAPRVPALDLIVDIFYKREVLAKQAEENTDAILDGDKESEKKQSQDDIDETVAKLLSRAGAHMEHTMVGAYVGLAVGQMAATSPRAAATVTAHLTRYHPFLDTLHKYYKFLSLTASAEPSIVAHVKATQRVIKFMEEADQKQDELTNQQPAAPTYSPPSDVPQDLTYNNSYSSSSSDRMSSSMENDGYH